MFKTFFVVAKHVDKVKEARDAVENLGFSWDDESPDFVVSVGGDGTYLMAERSWPGIPKILVKDSMNCFRCHNEPLEKIVKKVKEGKTRIREIMKLEAKYEDHSLIGVNDIVVRNTNPTQALRFRVCVNDEILEDEFIADGVVVATPFGSTGYYHAMSRESFNEGIGVSFNNPIKKRENIRLGEDDFVEIEVTRGEAHLCADNDKTIHVLGEGEKVKVFKSGEAARLIVD